MSEEIDLRRLFDVWLSSERKARIIVFFHENPGLIETVDGLARRLGMNPEALADDIQDHVRLGVLTERKAGDKSVLVYDTRRRNSIEALIERLAKEEEGRL